MNWQNSKDKKTGCVQFGGITSAGGFTIVEVLVVILLISLLAVFVVPQYLDRLEGGKREAARAQVALVEQHLNAFLLDCGRYPEQSEGLEALRTAPAGVVDKWRGPYGKASHLIDPWGNAMQYFKPGKVNPNSFDIVCYGKDGQPGGEGDNADIYND